MGNDVVLVGPDFSGCHRRHLVAGHFRQKVTPRKTKVMPVVWYPFFGVQFKGALLCV